MFIEGLPAVLVLGLLILARLDDRIKDARWLRDDQKHTLRQVLAHEEARKQISS